MMKHAAILAFLMSAAASASAQGIIIPDEPDVPPLALERHAVRVEIDTQAAVTTVEQVFHNNTDRRLEAKYIFPIPKGAALTRFTMLINGRETSGEMVEKDKAAQIYQSIVRRSLDPGLLEYLGSEVFRANIFPIEPKSRQTITVRFTQALAAENGLVAYVYPVRAGTKHGPTVHGEASMEVAIKSPIPIHNVYSPSHPVNVERKDERQARVTWSTKNAAWNRDFQLYYGYGDKDVGLNLVTYRPDPSEPGYFMVLVSPRTSVRPQKVVERDIVFVVDTSGSMAGEKIEQAKTALKHCIQNLNDGDRFNIVRFSSDVYAWKDGLVSAKDLREAALLWVDKFQAAGGTDIMGALKEALKCTKDPARPFVIVFMTDGKPTLGETTDPREILSRVVKSRNESVRIFTWGVGYDVDTQLLDGIAEQCRGVSEYVRPEEDIAVKVGAFWGKASKASKPILADLEFTVAGEKVRLVQMHPSPLPDLYTGGQMVLIGRYTGDGHVALRIAGSVNGEKELFTYEATFAASEAKNEFLEPLWARRRIGHLLDAIRLHGESKEIKDEVIALSKKYGIQTPYTSWLILEDGTAMPTSKDDDRSGGRLDPRKADEKLGEHSKKPGTGGGASGDKAEEERDRREHNESTQSFAEGFEKKEGKSAVDTASALRQLKEAEKNTDGRSAPYVKAAGTRFFTYRSMWVDERFTADMALTVVKFGSEAYFRLIEKHPELVPAFKVGTELLFVTGKGRALVVASKGEEKLTDEQIEALFKK